MPCRTPGSPSAIADACSPVSIPFPAASTPISFTPFSSIKSANMPMEFDPPPTHAITTSGSFPSAARICFFASRLMTL